MSDLMVLATEVLNSAAVMLLGAWLVHSGMAKQTQWLRWWQALDGYRILPKSAKRATAAIVPRAEIGLGVALWLPWLDRYAAVVVAAMMLVFAVAIGVNLASGITRFDCGCTPGQRSPHAATLLARALALAGGAGVLAMLPGPELLVRVPVGLALIMLLLLAAAWRALRAPARVAG